MYCFPESTGSRDRHLLLLRKYDEIEIVTPEDFLKKVL
jgi:predicted nucleic acid-binding protein